MTIIKTMTGVMTIAVMTLLGTTPQAEARYKRHVTVTIISGYASCGCPIYKQRYIRGYARCGTPYYGYRRVKMRHSCRAHRPVYRERRHHHRYEHRGHHQGHRYERRGHRRDDYRRDRRSRR